MKKICKESAKATEYLISTMKGWKLQAEEVSGVVDDLTALDMEFATSAGDIAQAMAKANVSASLAGVDRKTYESMLTAVMDVGQQGADVVGTAFKTLFARYGNVKSGKYANNYSLADSNSESSEETTKLNDVETVLNKVNIKNNKIYKGIYALVNTYGILTFEETHELLKKLGISVKYDDFENLILTEYNDSRGYFFTGNEYGKLIYNMGYEESYVLHDYCDVLSQDVNRNLDASIIKMIGEDKYIYELKPYKSLIKYISNEYEDFKLDHKYFDMMIVLDFLSTVQLDEELAINNFYHNIDYNFEDLDKEEKEKILKYLFEIFKCYPKWNKRGNL